MVKSSRKATTLGLLHALMLASAITALPSAEVPAPLVERANAWKFGDKLPSELFQFRQCSDDLACDTDSMVIFREITNYPLLWNVMFLPCDQRILEFAAARALEVSGPKRFFSDLKQKSKSNPTLPQTPRFHSLLARANERNIVVDGLFIDDKDMSREQAEKVFAKITRDLSDGISFERARKKYQKAYEYSYYETFADGKRVKQTRTTLGNYGNYTISRRNRSALPFADAEVPQDHARTLLKGQKDDIVILRDAGQKRSILYRIREVYSPGDNAKPSNQSLQPTASRRTTQFSHD